MDDAVERAVSQVGPSYRRRTLTGLLRSDHEGVIVGEQRVRSSMRRITPTYIERRRQHTYRQLNPAPYNAEYTGHKMHINQNEKLVRFGVTHVAASDGYSGKILSIITMLVKNPILIYEDLSVGNSSQYGNLSIFIGVATCMQRYLGQSSQLMGCGTKLG